MRREGVEDDGSAVTIELVKIKEQVDEEGARIDDDSAVEEIAHKLKMQYKTVLESFREVIYVIRTSLCISEERVFCPCNILLHIILETEREIQHVAPFKPTSFSHGARVDISPFL